LTPIVRDPSAALLSKGMRDVLTRLAAQKKVTLGILSGRKLDQIRRLAGIPRILYGGNHGFELWVHGRRRVLTRAIRFLPLMRRLGKELSRRLDGFAGVRVEDKGITLSVHYRCCSAAETSRVLTICRQFTAPWEIKRRVRVTRGKKVYEIRPAIPWDKGKAVEFFLKQLPHSAGRKLVIYIGDDTTDEDAFITVKKRRGWAIRVGGSHGETEASYRLAGVIEVRRLLTLLSTMETRDEVCGC
ncbi:MAG: trehalose-phosphatase, partial [Candidatus Omnitrophica bacterium]|nr:trehalose-phosphatase [Candidatus Omnitrophota bacterium]